jgi:retinol dehydrogenase-14
MSRPVCVVTGASAGIGAATVEEISRRGYEVALTGRDPDRLEQVAERCRGNGVTARTYRVDAAHLDQVRELAAALVADWPRLDVLVNKAALAVQKRRLTEDGHEQMFAVNHLAPYLLTRLLLDRLEQSAPSRVVVVASDAHRLDRLDPDDYTSERAWQPMKVYGRTKLCNLYFAQELSRRVEDRGIAVSTLHPRFVSTILGRDNGLANLVLRSLGPFIKSPRSGATTSVQLATEPLDAQGGAQYFVNGKAKKLAPYATDPVLARRLWDDSARMVGLPP